MEVIKWRENDGRLPSAVAGKRVVVELENGMILGREPVSPSCPAGWPATGKGACNWRRNGFPFDIKRFLVIGA